MEFPHVYGANNISWRPKQRLISMAGERLRMKESPKESKKNINLRKD
jgi:hypothetical protein